MSSLIQPTKISPFADFREDKKVHPTTRDALLSLSPQFRVQGQVYKDSALPHRGEGEMSPQVDLVKRGREETTVSYLSWMAGEDRSRESRSSSKQTATAGNETGCDLPFVSYRLSGPPCLTPENTSKT